MLKINGNLNGQVQQIYSGIKKEIKNSEDINRMIDDAENLIVKKNNQFLSQLI